MKVMRDSPAQNPRGTDMTYQIKNLKTLSSGAYTASLYKDGKRIATIENDGGGGPALIWSTASNATTQDRLNIEADLTAWAQTSIPEWSVTFFGAYPTAAPNWEIAVAYLLDVVEFDQIAKKAPAGHSLIRRADGALGYAHLSPSLAAHTFWDGQTWKPVLSGI